MSAVMTAPNAAPESQRNHHIARATAQGKPLEYLHFCFSWFNRKTGH